MERPVMDRRTSAKLHQTHPSFKSGWVFGNPNNDKESLIWMKVPFDFFLYNDAEDLDDFIVWAVDKFQEPEADPEANAWWEPYGPVDVLSMDHEVYDDRLLDLFFKEYHGVTKSKDTYAKPYPQQVVRIQCKVTWRVVK
jgi:hypothetical protein